MDHQGSPLATAAESTNRPISSFEKLEDDWSVELSPIAHIRDSLLGTSNVLVSISNSDAVHCPLQIKKKENAVEQKNSTGKECLRLGETFGVEESSWSSKSSRTIFRNASNQTTARAKSVREADSRSWFLFTEPATPPLSTSSEFSLESLSENDGNSKEGSLEIPGTGRVESRAIFFTDREAEKHQDASIRKSTQAVPRIFYPGEEKTKDSVATPSYLHSKPTVAMRNSHEVGQMGDQSPKESSEDIVHLDESSLGASESEQTVSFLGRDDSTRLASINDSTSSKELDEMNHTAEMDALIEDATIKVRNFIHELSVMDSSFLPILSSNEGTSRSQDSDDSTRYTRQPEHPKVEPSPINRSSRTTNRYQISAKHGLRPLSAHKSAILSSVGLLGSPPGKLKTLLTLMEKGDSSASSRNGSVDAGMSSTPGKFDFTNAKKEVGASSFEFIQKIRGAAQRRKQNLARSRDSLVAKEREQREAIASSRMAMNPPNAIVSIPKPRPHDGSPLRGNPVSSTSFKARPLPPTTRDLGGGGLAGVPKIAKKPVTVPTSPRLGGCRRLSQPKIKTPTKAETRPCLGDRQATKVQPKKQSCSPHLKNGTFKARPVPATTGEQGSSGQAGVPKVLKRPVTTISAPCLGRCRRQSSVAVGKENQKEARRVSTGMPWCHAPKSKASPVSTSSLLGLDLLSIKSCDVGSSVVTAPPNAHVTAFKPRSTQRAKKRAEFEAQRMVNELRRLQEEIKGREKQVQKMYKELDSLRQVI